MPVDLEPVDKIPRGTVDVLTINVKLGCAVVSNPELVWKLVEALLPTAVSPRLDPPSSILGLKEKLVELELNCPLPPISPSTIL